MKSIDLYINGPNTRIEISCPTTLDVNSHPSFGSKVVETLSGTATPETVVYRIKGGMTVDDTPSGAGSYARLFGTFCAPEGVLRVARRARLEGALYGWQVEVGSGVRFTARPATRLND